MKNAARTERQAPPPIPATERRRPRDAWDDVTMVDNVSRLPMAEMLDALKGLNARGAVALASV